MENRLFTKQEAIALIKENKSLVIAGTDDLLSQLPDGNWIGGSNPYLQDQHGKTQPKGMLYLIDFSSLAVDTKLCTYDHTNIHNITTDAYENGMILTLMPAGSQVVNEFALKSPEFENQFINPLLGWVSGTLFEKFGIDAPTCYLGSKRYEDKAVVLHMQLPDNKVARLEVVNAYKEDPDSPIVTFPDDGFNNTDCYIDGIEHNFYNYMDENNIEYRQMIANYSGAGVNVGLIKNDENKSIFFTGPVFKDTEYKFSIKKTNNYQSYLDNKIGDVSDIKYTYSCLLNLFNFELDNVDMGIPCVYTYGEIAYQLLNLTFVYLKIDEK